MNRRNIILFATLLLSAGCAAAWYIGLKHQQAATLASVHLPKGWHRAGSPRYDTGTDRQVRHGGNSSAYLRFGGGDRPRPDFGGLMQRFNADGYRGKTLRMSAYLKTEEAEKAGLWMRIDGYQKSGIRFDNMGNRPVKGTTDWQRYEITLDVPQDGLLIYYGALLSGPGRVWVDDFRFEVDGREVTEAAAAAAGGGGDGPLNPGFEL